MEQRASKIVNNCSNTNIYSYLETSGGQSLTQYLNAVNFFDTIVHWTSVAAGDIQTGRLTSRQAGRHPSRQGDIQAGRHSGRQGDIQAGRHSGRETSRQAGRMVLLCIFK